MTGRESRSKIHPVQWALLIALIVLGGAVASAAPARTVPAVHTFQISGHHFLLDGKSFQIISGEMHYTRIPRAQWRSRFRMARAMGLNTISTYVFWNVHEPRPGVFDFSGQNDLAEYLREAQQEGLFVILRPGPYVCAEWDLGGYPSWLLKSRSMNLRSTEPSYLAAVQAWYRQLSRVLQPLLLQNGGPILAIQVENEYGSFGSDHAYMADELQALRQAGITAPVMYTADGPEELAKGTLPELPAVVNFGTGEAKASFATLERFRPDGPRMSGEYWDGWFDHWGEAHHVTDGAKQAAELKWMLSRGYSVNLYMFDGGTSFGWYNGANSNGTNYQPDTTSYDYDAPVNEAGEPTRKFFLLRDAITSATGKAPPSLPAPEPRKVFPVEPRLESASLWKNLSKPVHSNKLLTMEDLNQAFGYILYRTRLQAGPAANLVIHGLHDYAQLYLDKKLVGTLDRRLGQSTLKLRSRSAPVTLDILVENSGRVNFTTVLRGERKGIIGSVTVDGKQPASWDIFSLPMANTADLRYSLEPCRGPCFFRTRMQVDAPANTYLDTQRLGKGEMWLNGRPLGRFWSIGPQFALFTPGSWLHRGSNLVTFFDLKSNGEDLLRSVRDPIFHSGKPPRE